MNNNTGFMKWIMIILGHLIVLLMLTAPMLARNHEVTKKDRSQQEYQEGLLESSDKDEVSTNSDK